MIIYTISDMTLDMERALYGAHDCLIKNCTFDGPADGESALKECREILVENCDFRLRYPFWHVTGANVKKLQQALTLLGYYKGAINSRYDTATTSAVKAFQKKKGLSQDGIAGPVTLSALFSTSAYKTERLYWFKNGSKTIPKHAVFTVKDIKTGKTLQMKRWSGANHIDAEPLTKNDTKTLKAIYGGKWSWDRRPILVKYNGHVYAASMNGMPHGTTTINNGFPGHICIHFYGSKTHETKRVDPDHKQAEATAMKYTW